MTTTDEVIQSHFNFASGKAVLPWYPRDGKRDDLARLFGVLGFRLGVEVGTQRGRFAEVMFQEAPGLQLICVDHWKAYGTTTQEHQDEIKAEAVRRLRRLRATIVEKPSLEAVRDFEDGCLDFVYIDANHEFDDVVRDIIEWSNKVRMGGIVALHDYHSWGGTGVIEAVNAYTRCHGIHPWYVTAERFPSAWWVKK
jgi:predicted O-methyltransferase YrrM